MTDKFRKLPKADLLKRLAVAESIGAQMANVMFNLGQRKAGEPLPKRDIDTFNELRRAWDNRNAGAREGRER